MRNRFADQHVIELYPAGRAMPQGTVMQVEALFEEYYHRYHYLSKLTETCRTRILALNQAGDLMGFASLQQKGTFAVLSNLLVASKAQGKGYGSALEEVRIKLSRDLGLVL